MFELLRPYLALVRLWVLIIAMMFISGYVLYLKYHISDQHAEILFLRQKVTTCHEDLSRLRRANEALAQNLDALHTYYHSRKCLNLHDGALTDEEMELK